ncbi:hypothetical protein [Paenibacillus campi]|uniref:hypothetical protein n=1 Tax=Paenibacillus campi TaxID=3106031 RepID=UPI002B000F8A|nr:hypothetical protein [Paenibacillus sp. SGZ-1014]
MTVHIPDVDQYVREMVRQAYEVGMEDGRSLHSLPHVLTQLDLEAIFQASRSTIEKIVARPDFPKLTVMKGRYPRELVFEWIAKNSKKGDTP